MKDPQSWSLESRILAIAGFIGCRSNCIANVPVALKPWFGLFDIVVQWHKLGAGLVEHRSSCFFFEPRLW